MKLQDLWADFASCYFTSGYANVLDSGCIDTFRNLDTIQCDGKVGNLGSLKAAEGFSNHRMWWIVGDLGYRQRLVHQLRCELSGLIT